MRIDRDHRKMGSFGQLYQRVRPQIVGHKRRDWRNDGSDEYGDLPNAFSYFDQAKILHLSLEEESAANGKLIEIAVDTVNFNACGQSPAHATA